MPSEFLYENDIDKWSSEIRGLWLNSLLIFNTILFPLAWIIFISPYGYLILPFSFYGGIKLLLLMRPDYKTLHRMSYLPAQLPNSKLGIAIQKVLVDNDIQYSTVGDNIHPIHENFDKLTLQKYILVNKNISIRIRQMTILIGKTSNNNYEFVKTLAGLIDEQLTKSERKLLEDIDRGDEEIPRWATVINHKTNA